MPHELLLHLQPTTLQFLLPNLLFEGTKWALLGLTVELLFRLSLATVVVLRKGSRPSVATAWVLIVIAFPLIGIIAYLMVGELRLGSRRRKSHKLILDLFQKSLFHKHDDPRALKIELDPTDTQIAFIAQRASQSPVTAGNITRLFGESQNCIEQLLLDINRATQNIHCTTYIWLDDRVGEAIGNALMLASDRGVTCRILVDGQGSRAFLKSTLCRRMRERGVQVVAALPTHFLRALFHRIDIRNHRKILVIDCEIGWMGSMNIAAPEFAVQPRFAPWVDCMVRLEGPVVRELQLIFAEDWYLDTNESLAKLLECMPAFHTDGLPVQIMASGPNFNNDAVRSLLIASIQVARKEIVLTTPYFVPDSDMFSALCVAAERGVSVHLVVPRRNNSWLVALASRGRYSAMLASGIQIHEYTKGLLHSKTVTVDTLFSVITSSNLDRRSFEINFEVSAIMFADSFAKEVRALQQTYMNHSVDVTTASWGEPSIRQRLAQNFAGLVSPLI
ncbi:MAG: cardiolipin synthase [Planctomycetota bacterium]|nr:cardiolipin synthase [Planctomycetota bacterium]